MEKMTDDSFPPDLPVGANPYERKYKSWREWYSVLRFLQCLGEKFDPIYVRCVVGDPPPDVSYLDARFEVKEILDEDRRPREEAKQYLERAKMTGKPILSGELMESKVVEPIVIGNVVLDRLDSLSRKNYRTTERSVMDLLFYYNRMQDFLVQGELWDPGSFSAYGFRSVSAIVAERVSLVFYAAPDSPEFLRRNVGLYCECG